MSLAAADELLERLCSLLSLTTGPDIDVITGGPNSGKSAVVASLKALGCNVLDEVATTLIQIHGMAIKQDVLRFQRCVFNAQVSAEIDLRIKNKTAICDRGLVEGIAYFRARGIALPREDCERLQKIISASSKPLYRRVFVFETIEEWDDNGIRDENVDFSKKLADEMCTAYSEFGMPPVRVPIFSRDKELSIAKRVEFVLQEKGKQ